MKKIVFLIGSLQNGGAERVISVLANEFVKKYEVHILTIMEDKGAHIEGECGPTVACGKNWILVFLQTLVRRK